MSSTREIWSRSASKGLADAGQDRTQGRPAHGGGRRDHRASLVGILHPRECLRQHLDLRASGGRLMYIYPEDVKEIALALRVEASKQKDPGEFKRWVWRAEALERIADEAVQRYGKRATVSIDASAARGYALPMERKS